MLKLNVQGNAGKIGQKRISWCWLLNRWRSVGWKLCIGQLHVVRVKYLQQECHQDTQSSSLGLLKHHPWGVEKLELHFSDRTAFLGTHIGRMVWWLLFLEYPQVQLGFGCSREQGQFWEKKSFFQQGWHSGPGYGEGDSGHLWLYHWDDGNLRRDASCHCFSSPCAVVMTKGRMNGGRYLGAPFHQTLP